MGSLQLPADPEFPPIYTGHDIDASGDPVRKALDAVAAGTAQGGDIFWSRATSIASCAIVLEPDKPLEIALQAVPLAMVALGDALGAIAPPNVAVTYRWPSIILVNGAKAGWVKAVLPEFPKAGRSLQRLVLAVMLRVAFESEIVEPGERADETALREEGCGDIDRTQILESFSRHFLAWLDRWEDEGFEAVHQLWLFRAADLDGQCSIETRTGSITGTMLGLDDNGGLIMRTDDGVHDYSLAEHAAKAAVPT